ncbi:16S rRNA (cytidine(1402)-2'-O)-methyltransferase [Allosediminivita pacifica]|uniref:Ribosomal RNA small subunit methyltransferase I n=1 Tax=Allosediminivita pacifica TaxID=1267769 RepID=A0A2T6ANZ8_9RHOB|nr:16S rRNA (cytidine(1402)-2'-O)-methyltransferase [Allosediminivita pacifica]PTX45538.1 16S rRNA (cytidine1402-2'-O)-methyltransferase [Allosediminivita pacifica]GGB20232.1 ribosomal RNA small subunit methyltransferase I [Allosediminivita pacifica]
MIGENAQVPRGLHLVAVPIGNARDITLRALDLLRGADVLAAEDTRSLRKLMEIHGVPLGERQVVAYHEHNGDRARPRLLAALEAGQSVVYASEAGTPLVSDPGFDLVRAAREAGYPVTSAPGASAVLTALTVAGLPTDRFLFAGFLPNAKGARRKALGELAGVPATLVLYESPKRVAAALRDAAEVMGGERPGALCRELTKKFEEVLTGTLDELAEAATERTLKGEMVLLIGKGDSGNISETDVEQAVKLALEDMSVRDAAASVSRDLGRPKREVYQLAMRLASEAED